MKPALFAVAVALFASNAHAFAPISVRPPLVQSTARRGPLLRMAGDEIPSKTQITSVNKKELAWDSEKGRFFETNLAAEECIPDEEFCTLDDQGKPVRLTLAEKERIFLDSLQVRGDFTNLGIGVINALLMHPKIYFETMASRLTLAFFLCASPLSVVPVSIPVVLRKWPTASDR
jgi:hypothetical protein